MGIGGEDRHEVEICGVDPRTRGRRIEECLEVLRGLLSADPITYRGRFFSLDEALIVPPPSPPIPLVVGGRSEAAEPRRRPLRARPQRLFLSPRTVEAHIRQIFLKLGLREAPAYHRHVVAVLTFLRSD